MRLWRWASGLALVALAAGPLLLAFGEALGRVFGTGDSRLHQELFADGPRLWHLATNTLALVAGTLAVALPLGTLLAVLFLRTDLPGRHFFLGATLFALFIPLPMIVSAWQALIGADGFFPIWFWGASAGRPWSAGLGPAIWVHALAGLPWVILIVGVGLGAVESALEEEALLAAGPWRVLWRVTLPRCRGAIAAAALWLGLLTAADISVTDVLLVPTFAEEIHTAITMGGEDALAHTLLLALPAVALTWILLFAAVPTLERSLPSLPLDFTRRRLFSLGKLRWAWLCGCLVAGVALLFVPLSSLVWKVGLAGTPRIWSAGTAWHFFADDLHVNGLKVFATLAVALLTGVFAAALALYVSWAALRHRPLRILLLGLVTLALAVPAPVASRGLLNTILFLVRWCPVWPVPELLYDGPSFAPIVWAHLLRFFPFAVAILWPAVRLVPIELRDAARLEGAGPLQELWHVYRPMTRRACVLAVWTVTSLSLGEVGASVSARVETPGCETFAKLLFDRMHYGVDASVASLALVLLAEIGVIFGVMCVVRRCLAFLASRQD